jgi:hypothetical protein
MLTTYAIKIREGSMIKIVFEIYTPSIHVLSATANTLEERQKHITSVIDGLAALHGLTLPDPNAVLIRKPIIKVVERVEDGN